MLGKIDGNYEGIRQGVGSRILNPGDFEKYNCGVSTVGRQRRLKHRTVNTALSYLVILTSPTLNTNLEILLIVQSPACPQTVS